MKGSNILIYRYTSTLYSLAAEQNATTTVYETLKQLMEALKAVEAIHKIALNPKAPLNIKRKIWDVLIEVIQVEPLVASFLNVLLQNNRIHLLPKILDKFQSLLWVDQGITAVEMTTSIPLTGSVKTAAQKTLEKSLGSKVELNLKVDPNILGGAIIQFDSFMLDASVRSKVNHIRSLLLS